MAKDDTKPRKSRRTDEGARQRDTRSAPRRAAKGGEAPAAAVEMAPLAERLGALDLGDKAKALGRKEFLAAVAALTGAKGKDTHAGAEAALAILGKALAEGHGLNLPGMGKLKVRKVEIKDKRTVIACRVVQKEKSKKSADTPLAETGE